MDFDFEFEDEIFQTKKRANKSNALNDNYKAKIVTPKSFLDDSADGLDLDDAINLNKLKADHCYYTQDYEKSLHFYKSCLDLTLRSKNLNDTLFQRELEESLAMCHSFRGDHEEALRICEKLETKGENYSVMSSNLNLRLKLLTNNKTNPNYEDIIVTKLRLLILHPYYIPLWIKLAGLFDEMCKTDPTHARYYKICFYCVNELNKHGYFNRSEVMNKQKTCYQNWLETNKSKLKFNEQFEQEAAKKLEQMDQLSDNDRISKSRETVKLSELYDVWFNGFNNIEIN